MLFLFLLLSPPPHAYDWSRHEHALEQRRYFDAGMSLRPHVRRLDDPTAVRRYTELLLQHHSKSVGFRLFMLRNLLPGEDLYELRYLKEEVLTSNLESVVEHNLEALLQDASARHPKRKELAYARALYLYAGRDRLPQPQLEMAPAQAFQTLREALDRGVFCALSLRALAHENLLRGNPNPEETSDLLRRAHALNPADPRTTIAFGRDHMRQGRHQAAAELAEALLQRRLPLQLQSEGALLLARARISQGRYREGVAAAKFGLEREPRHPLLIMTALDALRAARQDENYLALLEHYLDPEHESHTSAFNTYLSYLRERDISPLDVKFMARYRERQPPGPESAVRQHTHLGLFAQLAGAHQEARAAFEQALELASAASLKEAKAFLRDRLRDLTTDTPAQKNEETP